MIICERTSSRRGNGRLTEKGRGSSVFFLGKKEEIECVRE
jgi:hypothetical protein